MFMRLGELRKFHNFEICLDPKLKFGSISFTDVVAVTGKESLERMAALEMARWLRIATTAVPATR